MLEKKMQMNMCTFSMRVTLDNKLTFVMRDRLCLFGYAQTSLSSNASISFLHQEHLPRPMLLRLFAVERLDPSPFCLEEFPRSILMASAPHDPRDLSPLSCVPLC